MKVTIISIIPAIAVISTTTTYAFAPPGSTTQQTQSQYSRLTNSAIAAAAIPSSVSVSNPYKNLPWNTEREEKRKQRRLTIENAQLFRELGLPEDATYEDVAETTSQLIAETALLLPKNEGLKKKIKIEIARDKIYQIRLNERITGVRSEQEDAARVSKLEEGGIEGL